MALKPALAALETLVRSIPPGRVASYGCVGKHLANPVSGLVVGRWMAHMPEDLPWWRVVGADGTLKTWKASPEAGMRQRMMLEGEGVVFDDDHRILPEFFVTDLL